MKKLKVLMVSVFFFVALEAGAASLVLDVPDRAAVGDIVTVQVIFVDDNGQEEDVSSRAIIWSANPELQRHTHSSFRPLPSRYIQGYQARVLAQLVRNGQEYRASARFVVDDRPSSVRIAGPYSVYRGRTADFSAQACYQQGQCYPMSNVGNWHAAVGRIFQSGRYGRYHAPYQVASDRITFRYGVLSDHRRIRID